MMRIVLLHFGVAFILTGCGVGGFWMNGNPFPAKPGPPPIEGWNKLDASAEQRIADSIDCGGSSFGPDFSLEKVQAERVPGEYLMKPSARLNHNWERCMLKKGYQYTGECDFDYQFYRERPACGAP